MIDFAVQNQEDTVQVGDTIRPIYIPAITYDPHNRGADRDHYYEGEYKVVEIRKDYAYALPDGSEGIGTVAYIDVNENLNHHARQAFTGFVEGDRYYYVSHFTILGRTEAKDDLTADPVIELTEDQKEIERLKKLIETMDARIGTMLSDTVHNSKVLTNNFYRLKERHNWCDEANSTAVDINEDLRGGLLIDVEQEFDIEVRVEASFSTTVLVQVTAATLEQAQEMVMDSPEEFIEQYEIDENLSCNGWTNVDYELY